MEVQFKLMRRHGDKAYILTEITGYDEQLPVVLAASTEEGARIPSDSFPFCNPSDPFEVEAVLRDGSLANDENGMVLAHTKNTAGIRLFVIVLPWMRVRRWVLEFRAIDSSGSAVDVCTKTIDQASFGLLSFVGQRTNHANLESIRSLDGRFVHDRIQIDFVRAVELEKSVLVSAQVEMPYHEQSSIEYDFLGDRGQSLPFEAKVIEDSITRAPDFGEYDRRHMVVSFEIDRAEPRLCLCATDTVGNVAPGFAVLSPKSLYRLMRETALDTMAADEDPGYDEWFAGHRADLPTLLEQVSCHFEDTPSFSIIVNATNAEIHYVHDLLSSFVTQSYAGWELILVNADGLHTELDDLVSTFKDERIFVLDVPEGSSRISAFQAGLAASEGDFVVSMDISSVLSPDALFEFARAINESPEVDVVYSDLDTFDADGVHFDPVFLPDFSPELLRSCNYIQDFFAVRSSLAYEVGELRGSTEWSVHYDSILRLTEGARLVYHVPRVLCHRRYAVMSALESEVFDDVEQEAHRKVLVSHCKRMGFTAEVLPTSIPLHFRVRHVVADSPLVSIVIITEDDIDQLAQCLRSLYTKTTYRNFEVIVVNRSQDDPASDEAIRVLAERYGSLSVISSSERSLAVLNNLAASHAQGDYLLFLNDDTRVMSDDFIETLLGYFQSEKTGIVGPKRLFSDGTIDHAGVSVGGGNVTTPLFRFMPGSWHGYLNRAVVAQNVTAVAEDCMMVSRSVFDRVGGFTTEFITAYAGIDFCLKVRELGLYTVFTPYAVLGHFRGLSRIHVISLSQQIKMRREASLMQYLWPELFVEGDPFFNPNLDPDSPYYALRH